MGSYARGGAIEKVETLNEDQTQQNPQITVLADGGWVVVFDNFNVDQQYYNVSMQRYDANGLKVGGETIVNSYGLQSQYDASVAGLADGGWVVTWNSYGQDNPATPSASIQMQRFDASGAPVGSETTVNTLTASSQDTSTVAALPDGGWLVTYNSYLLDGSSYAVAQQRYDSDGNKVGGETVVNSTTTDNQYNSDVIVLKDGGWLVSWISFGQDAASTSGIFAQRFNADGTRAGDEFQVNTTVANDQYNPQSAALADGGFVIAWQSSGQDNSDGSSGIFLQHYSSDGSKIGGEILVNSTTLGPQYDAEVAALADGGWMVSWTSYQGGDYAVCQQRFDALGNRIGGETYIGNHAVGHTEFDSVTAGLADGSWVATWEQWNGHDYDVLQRHFALDITGTAGADNLTGTHWDETLIGYGGNDVLNGGLGDDILIGGLGDDTYIINSPGDDIQELAGQGYDTVKSSIGFNMANDATEALILLGTANINGTGNALDNAITGNSGANILSGGNGNDVINGGAGNDDLRGGNGNDILNGGPSSDKIDGGAGIDTVSYADATTGITFSLATTTAQNTVGSGTEIVVNVENVIGSAFADHLTGSNGNNVIEGGAGNDVLNGGLGIDTASYASASAGVTVNLALTAAQNTVGAGSDTLTGFENLLGSKYNDTLTGDANANMIDGGAGNDLINGGAGSDTVTYGSATAGVTVNLTLTTAQNTIGAGSDTLSQIESLTGSSYNDVLSGNAGANRVDGGAGADTLNGNDGNDGLIGGLGNDQISGGTGTDIFRFATGETGTAFNSADRIMDFNQEEHDTVDLHAIDANIILTNDQAFNFIGTSAFSNTAGELRYDASGGYTVIQGDMNGDGAVDLEIVLVGTYALTSSDFSL